MIGASLAAAAAHAHPETTPTLVNRYVTVALHGNTAEVSVALLYGAVPAQQVRTDADSDHDGVLSRPEIADLAQRLKAQSTTWLGLFHNRETINFAPTVVVDMGGNLGVTPAPMVAEARMLVNIGASDHSFDLRPGVGPRFLGETEVTCVTGGGWALAESSTEQLGETPAAHERGSSRSYKADGPVPAGWNVRFRVRPSDDADPAGTGKWGWLPRVIAALATAMAAFASWRGWRAWRRRKSRTQTRSVVDVR